MKSTDYIPRATPFLTKLSERHKRVIEIGSDVGAHAHALLKYCPHIESLLLVDIWDKEFYRGYCEGRLFSSGFKNKVGMIQSDGIKAGEKIVQDFDAIYIDITHDYETVLRSLQVWWPKLKEGGILGYRNYSNSNINNVDLNRAVDEFIKDNDINFKIELGEILLYK